MRYRKADQILPPELLEKVQEYVDGTILYIPKTEEHRKNWGEGTATRDELRIRNARIYSDYLAGESMKNLSSKYFLSLKSIQRIIGQEKKM
ncbi:hypothetical protein CE91St62_34190 [Lachnospiraceae bacterium]|uniref:CD3324 family protein n=1 Tax=Extibacter sp. GGCC_0201 TaxID=2731209 RepID=UPI001AA18D68|nr:CD3324 family protein [Extibacter sp. GGCC_0201]MBO1722520.1 hypothetical protein [Extibacter sp. GGCC_0201]BDF35356.1 hypothetical protein CE91St61_34310 [Lachnospiraceae bacterium]BDF39358.1 hypothetical protein CE91St62_34190 [Lachnospiraceae bacterium]